MGPADSDPTADRWQAVRRLLPEALDRPPAERPAFLDGACASDDALRAELDALLDAHDRADAFLDPLDAVQAAVLLADDGASMTGTTVGPYRIERELGRGGMGVVYLAHDTRLGRRVALKFVPPHLSADARARRRLVAEARAAAALDHPCAAAVHDIGETADGRLFIAMAYAEGETLRGRIEAGPLPVAKAVSIARRLAEGLGVAHARGIVHRDVKPSNVIVAPDGAVKLVDFGIARAAGAPLTREGATPGTVAYMSPEQTRGEPADARADLWSLGVVLYEMLTGARPFRSDTDATLIHAIRHDAPVPLNRLRAGVPAAVADLVARCLHKTPAARPASADAVRAALAEAPDAAPSAPATAPLRVAVLPLESYSADPDDAYFADGMTDELTARLSRLGDLRVIARTSAAAYRGTAKTAATIGRELGVGTLLAGGVRRSDRRVWITVRLVDAATEEHRWAETFEADRDDVLAVQRTIATHVSRALGLAPPPDGRPSATRRAPRPEAYDAYLKGRHLLTKWAPGPLQAARDHFQRAIDLDPTFARAWAGLADTWVLFGYLALFAPADTYTQGRAAAERALALDDTLAEAHTALGSLLVDYDLDWDGAHAHFRRALDLDPSYAFAHQYYAEWLRDRGRFEDALDAVHRAQALDPLSPYAVLIEGIVLWFARRYDDALATLQRLLRVHGAYPPAHLFRSLILLDLGDAEAALAEADLADPDRTFPDALSARARGLARLGRPAEATAVLAEMDAATQTGYVSPFLRALVYLDLGERERVLPLLEQARDEQSWFLRMLKVAPLLDPLRDDPGFQALLADVGLAG